MPEKSVAIVTGASSGLGKEFVKLLLREGGIDEIWAIARTQKKLEELRFDYGTKIKTFSIDLSNKKAILEFEKILKETSPNIPYLINNAGFAKFCSYGDLSIEESLNMIDLNCGGVVAMGLLCMPFMKSGSRIVNIASQAAFQPVPYQNIYSSTKAFIRNYSRALNIEVKEKGISVTAVCPGWMKTELFERAEIGAKKATRRYVKMTTPDKVAAKALKDAKRGKDMSVYSLYVKGCHFMTKLLPQKMIMKIWLKQQGL